MESARSAPSISTSLMHQSGSMAAVERSVNLPEKYLMLCNFFNVITSVIPLLRSRGKSSTLTNICPKIQSLTDRRFTISHLAQLKYILPEVILVKKILVRDEHTECMKEELLITLDMEAVKGSKNLKDLREIFRANLEGYYKAHSEENDIPEGELPALFHQSKQNEASSIDKSSCMTAASCISPSFQRSFSRRALSEKLVNQTAERDSEGLVDDIHGTPAKEALTPIRLMATTPAIKLSKRCYMSSDDDDTCDMPTKLARRRPLIKSLKFDAPEDSAYSDLGSKSSDSDINEYVSENLMLSVR